MQSTVLSSGNPGLDDAGVFLVRGKPDHPVRGSSAVLVIPRVHVIVCRRTICAPASAGQPPGSVESALENHGVSISSQHSACRSASSRTDQESFGPLLPRRGR